MYNCLFPPVNQTILLEATKKMTRYFKKPYKHNKSHHNSTDSCHPCRSHYNVTHPDKHKCKFHKTNDQVKEIIGQTCASKTTKSEPEDIKKCHDSDSPDSNLESSSDSEWLSWIGEIIEVKLSNMKYTANFPGTINNDSTISVWHRRYHFLDVKSMFDKQPNQHWFKHTYEVNGANGNSLGPIGMATCTLVFPKFQQVTVCKHLLWPVILGLDFSHNYLIAIDWFATN